MTEELEKPLLGPENFNREGIDLVSFATVPKLLSITFSSSCPMTMLVHLVLIGKITPGRSF